MIFSGRLTDKEGYSTFFIIESEDLTVAIRRVGTEYPDHTIREIKEDDVVIIK